MFTLPYTGEENATSLTLAVPNSDKISSSPDDQCPHLLDLIRCVRLSSHALSLSLGSWLLPKWTVAVGPMS